MPLRDAKHFLDEYEDKNSRGYDDGIEKGGQRPEAARWRGLIIPPALLRCGECGLESGTHVENMAHRAPAP